ncbi:MAG: ShlB/FhaC/HecB family hemolysin secretion/activation protein [Parachlamydiales bacterium]|nr:ShlB/FhaC/HecB family hemolysin secretion/activation protein [Parachlamydiales bacterium]
MLKNAFKFFVCLPLALSPQLSFGNTQDTLKQDVEVAKKGFDKTESKQTKDLKYPIEKISIAYVDSSKKPINVEDLNHINVLLVKQDDTLTGLKDEGQNVAVPINSIGKVEKCISVSGLVNIAEQIVQHFTSKGYIGIRVFLAEGQIDEKGQDIRKENKDLVFEVLATHVKDIHTKSQGGRFENQEVNHPSHTRIAKHFPVKCDSECSIDSNDSVLDGEAMNEYLFRINRHPGRMVTTEITDFATDGSVELELLINENSPWHGFVNTSNTGTESTGNWIQRFGYVNYQLSNHDDILSLEYDTAFFNHMHSLSTYYEAPFWDCERVRWRVDAWKSTFDVQALEIQNMNFSGSQWQVGPSIIANVYQYDDFFLDFNAQINWLHVYVNNSVSQISGNQKFFLPNIGLLASRKRITNNFIATVSYQKNLPHVAGTSTSPNGLLGLGRNEANPSFGLINYNFFGSFYIAPESHMDENTLWLVHELALTLGGQYAFDYRLIPQKEGTIGGLYTVRGYPQGILAGDSTTFFQAEYRRHLPRGPLCRECPKAFGNRDWDFFWKLFLDGGYTHINRQETNELDYSIYGTGGGVEFVWGSSLVIRGDIAVSLNSIHEQGYKAGTFRSYLSATFVF